MIDEPNWLSEKAIKIIHEILIARIRGTPSILNSSLLGATLDKPKFTYQYEPDSSISKLAAAYGYGFVKNYCFRDGNKRVALASVATFLHRNGYHLNASEVEVASFFLDLAGTIET